MKTLRKLAKFLWLLIPVLIAIGFLVMRTGKKGIADPVIDAMVAKITGSKDKIRKIDASLKEKQDAITTAEQQVTDLFDALLSRTPGK